MKIESTKEKLQDAILKAERITGKNVTLPVLECLYFEAAKNHLKIRATNLDLGIEISIPVKVSKEGVVAVPGSVLKNFITNLYNDDSITLEAADGNLSVSTKSTSTLINTQPHADFPTIPSIEGQKSFTVSARNLIKGFRSVLYSASVSTIKPELSSVYMYPEDGGSSRIVFVATDSFRLAEKRVSASKNAEFDGVLIPAKNVLEIVRAFGETEGDVKVLVDKHQIAFSYEDVYLTSRLIEGNFPDYKQIIPKEYKTEVVVLKQDLLHALRMVQVFADQFNQIRIKAAPSEKILEVSSKNTQVGENKNRIQATFSGEDIDMNFNYKYIIDAFQSIEADSLSLNWSGASAPLVIRGVSDQSFLYLVMPMNR